MRVRTRRRVTLRAALLLGVLTVATIAATLVTAAVAADVSVRATLDRAQLAVGDTADLSVVVEGAQDVPAPALGDLNGLTVRYVGPSSQLSIVNGRASSSITHHFSITATKAGTFTIGPIEVEHEGKRYSAGTVTVRAVPGQPGRAAAPGGEPGSDQLRLVLTSPRIRAYLHERVPVTLTLTVGAVQVADVHYPTIPGDGFAIEPLRDPIQRREQTAQGMVQVVEFPTMLTPLRAGTLTIGPAALELSVPVRRGRDPFLDRFLGGDPFAGRRPITLQSEALQLEVLPLPEAGKPADFTGAVGRFALHVDAAPRQLTAGDPVTVTTTIHGDGNLEGIQPPAIAESDALKVYPVQTGGDATRTPAPNAAAGRARVVFEQVVIPQHAGTVTLPLPRFSYFDPADGAYHTATAPPIVLTVSASTQPAAQPPVGAPAAVKRAPTEQLGRDIVFIKDSPGDLVPVGARRHRSALFWSVQVLPLAVWALFVVYDRRRRRLSADPRLARFSAAGRSARRAIADAEATLRAGDRPAFYDRLTSTMRDYLSAKLDLPPGAVTADSVAARVRARGVSAEVADGLRDLFATCEQARFAPGGNADGDMRQMLERAESLVRALERERRAPIAAAAIVAIVALTGAALGAAALASGTLDITSDVTRRKSGPRAGGAQRHAEYDLLPCQRPVCGRALPRGGRRVRAHPGRWPRERAALFQPRQRPLQGGRRRPRRSRVRARTPAHPGRPGSAGQSPLRPQRDRGRRRVTGRPALVSARAARQLGYAAADREPSLRRYHAALDRPVPRTRARAHRHAGRTRPRPAVRGRRRIGGVPPGDRRPPELRRGHRGGRRDVRFEPSPTGTAHFDAKPGNVLRVLAIREQWAQVVRPDGKRGWIAAGSVAPL